MKKVENVFFSRKPIDLEDLMCDLKDSQDELDDMVESVEVYKTLNLSNK